MSVDGLLPTDTPKWIRNFIVGAVATVIIAVPMTLAWSGLIISQTQMEIEMVEINEIIKNLQKRGDKTDETVQRYEIKQAVMSNQMETLDEKVDRILEALER